MKDVAKIGRHSTQIRLGTRGTAISCSSGAPGASFATGHPRSFGPERAWNRQTPTAPNSTQITSVLIDSAIIRNRQNHNKTKASVCF